MNRPKNPAGLVIFHAGGPGVDAVSQAWANALNTSEAATFAGLEDFDFLLSTLAASSSPTLSTVPPTRSLTISRLPFVRRQQHSGRHIQHVGTAEVIQDWDAIRAALGYEQVHVVGVSYGTFVGAAYAAKFPDRVGHFVLDAVLPHGMPFQDMVTAQVAAINRLLLRADAFCLEDTSCPFHGQGKGSVVKAWETVLARAIQSPIPASQCGPKHYLRLGASVLLRSNPDFPKFNQALNQSLNGDASAFANSSSEENTDKSFAAFEALSTNSNSSDPAQMIYSQIWQFTSRPEPLPTQLPIMWVTADFDLNLPTDSRHSPSAGTKLNASHSAWRQPRLHRFTYHASHPIEVDFIRTGVFPAARNDALVTVIPPGGKRGTLADPYTVPVGAVAGDMSAIETAEFRSSPVPSKAFKRSGNGTVYFTVRSKYSLNQRACSLVTASECFGGVAEGRETSLKPFEGVMYGCVLKDMLRPRGKHHDEEDVLRHLSPLRVSLISAISLSMTSRRLSRGQWEPSLVCTPVLEIVESGARRGRGASADWRCFLLRRRRHKHVPVSADDGVQHLESRTGLQRVLIFLWFKPFMRGIPLSDPNKYASVDSGSHLASLWNPFIITGRFKERGYNSLQRPWYLEGKNFFNLVVFKLFS
ncbi:alpha/beta hydrolase fold-domain-containing protein [Mycena haematopus]|nr:alpha/beta hydrolase fold-domain-containing protein [Mycena haematopus]